MSRMSGWKMWVVVPLLGCGVLPEAQEPQALRMALTTDNGSNLNGSNLNGSNLNGSNLNGSNLNGGDLNHTLLYASFAGATREGMTGNKLDSAWLQGTEFFGTQGSSTFRGLDFDQAHFVGMLGDGRTVDLWVASLTPPAPGDDVWRYLVRYWDTARQEWHPICIRNDRTHAPAIPVLGRWDYRSGVPTGGAKLDEPGVFTFACEGSAITKCLHMGYKPWASSPDGQGLAAHHQACTRVIRADYCGDGTSYTVDGQWVNVWDNVGIQFDTEDWYVEAEWDEAGARCFSPHNRFHSNVQCYDAKKQAGCGSLSSFSAGTLLMTETPYKN